MYCAKCRRKCEVQFVPDRDGETDNSYVQSVCCGADVFEDRAKKKPYTVADYYQQRADALDD